MRPAPVRCALRLLIVREKREKLINNLCGLRVGTRDDGRQCKAQWMLEMRCHWVALQSEAIQSYGPEMQLEQERDEAERIWSGAHEFWHQGTQNAGFPKAFWPWSHLFHKYPNDMSKSIYTPHNALTLTRLPPPSVLPYLPVQPEACSSHPRTTTDLSQTRSKPATSFQHQPPT